MNRKRILSFDGLKGLSIIAVIAYHLFPSVIPGGFFMVNTFLVIGGFFFARSFEKIQVFKDNIQWKELASFFKKTIERLFIPLFWMIMLIVVGLFIIDPIQLRSLRSDILSGLFFVNNLFQLWSDRSYFVQMTNASPFTHLWYNSLHFQSVIISSLVMLILQRFKLSAPAKGIFWLGIVFLSHLITILLFNPGQDPSRVYYGIDSRYGSFAIGIAAAYVLPTILNLFYRSSNKRLIYNFIAFFAGLACLMIVFTQGDQSDLTYQLWMSVFNVISFLLVFSIAVGSPVLTTVLSFQPLAWIGQRSYSFYLWYYPIIVFTLQGYRYLGEDMNIVVSLSLLLIGLIGSLFYYWIESDGLGIWFGTHFNIKADIDEMAVTIENRDFLQIKWFLLLAYISLLVFFGRALIYSADNKSLSQFDLEYRMFQTSPNIQQTPYPALIPIKQVQENLKDIDKLYQTLIVSDFHTDDPIETLQKNYFQQEIYMAEIQELIDDNQAVFDEIKEIRPLVYKELTPPELLFATQVPVTFFGDSLAKLSGPPALDLFWEGNSYGEGSLQIWDALSIFEGMVARGEVAENVVVVLGTNAGLDHESMDDLMEIAGEDRNVFFVNTNSRVMHIEEVNSIIKDIAKKYTNAYEVDWHSYQKGNPDWYTLDEVHHSELGQDHFMILVARTMYENLSTNNLD